MTINRAVLYFRLITAAQALILFAYAYLNA